MKIKTAEATGKVLDYLVAKANGYGLHKDVLMGGKVHKGWWLQGYFPDQSQWLSLHLFRPSIDPSQSWSIIDREGIELFRRPTTTGHEWLAGKTRDDRRKAPHKAFGPNSLIAAMRVWAVYKLGEEVEVPDELFEATGD